MTAAALPWPALPGANYHDTDVQGLRSPANDPWGDAPPGYEVVDHDEVVDLQPHQTDAYLAASELYDIVWLCGGLGSGKTWLLCQYAWDMATVIAPGVDGLLIEPDFDTFEDVFMVEWRLAFGDSEGESWEVKAGKGSSRRLIIYWTDEDGTDGQTVIYVRSAMNSQTVRRIDGLSTIGWWIFDEPSRMLCGEAAFKSCVGRGRKKNLKGKALPVGLSKHGSRAPGLIVGSPDGFNWLTDALGLKQDHPPHGYTIGYPSPKHPNVFIRACRTDDNAENLRDGYAATMRQFYGADFFKQECESHLVRGTGQILPRWNEGVHVVPHNWAVRTWNERRKRHAIGLDWGWGTNAFLFVCLTADAELLVIDGWYGHGKLAEEMGIALHTMAPQYGGYGAGIMCDTATDGGIERFQRGYTHKGIKIPSMPALPADKGPGSWRPGIDTLNSHMTIRPGLEHPAHPLGNILGRARFFVSDHPNLAPLRYELTHYRERKIKHGQKRGQIMTADEADGPDHMIDCLRYAMAELVYMTQWRGAKEGVY